MQPVTLSRHHRRGEQYQAGEGSEENAHQLVLLERHDVLLPKLGC